MRERKTAMDNNTYEFYIKSPKWHRNIFIVFFIIGVLGDIAMLIAWLISKFDWSNYWGILIVFTVFLVVSPLGLYVWCKEVFFLKNGVFTYVKPFKKSQSAELSQVSRVEISQSVYLCITFVGKNGEKLISFIDDGNLFRNNDFVANLMHCNIPIVYI